jgi:hypothetical protein
MNLSAVLSSPTIKCPTCHSTRLRPSRWNRQEQALLRLLLSPYRCIACDRRFFKLNSGVFFLLRGAVLFSLVMAAILGFIYTLSKGGKLPQPAVLPAMQATGNGGTTQTQARGVASDAQMQFDLGSRYLAGEGAPRDHAEALKWLEMAASGGHVRARYNLGVIYKSGFGVQRNDALAFQWFDQAARQNHAEAQYQAALMHQAGTGVSVDWAKAYAWAQIAAMQGHIGAITLRDNLRQAMTPQQLQDGQQIAREWNVAVEQPAVAPPGAAGKG